MRKILIRKKLLLCLVLMASILPVCGQNIDFSQVDRLLRRGEGNDYVECRKQLKTMLPKAVSNEAKADVLWRLSKVSVVLGELETTKEGKRKVFGEGIAYGEQAIKMDGKDPQCYMWHCANIGRECQTHNLIEQASAVNPMLDDLNTILNTLGRKDCSEAWQAKAEIYYNHPFKSNDEAITFATNAVRTIPKDELRIQTYTYLAQMLWKRDKSAKKRKSTLSDREEALSLVKKAIKLYENSKDRTASDTREYKAAVKLMKEMEE